MVLPSSIFLSFLIALVRGGKLSALTALRFRGVHFLAAAVVLRLALIVPPLQSGLIHPAFGDLRYGGIVYCLSLLLTLLALLSNVRLPGLKIVATGMAFNFLAIAANLGQMPGAPDKVAASGYSVPPAGHWSNFTSMNGNTPLWFLGDNFLIDHPWPIPTVISFGDIVIILGVFWFFQRAMWHDRAA